MREDHLRARRGTTLGLELDIEQKSVSARGTSHAARAQREVLELRWRASYRDACMRRW